MLNATANNGQVKPNHSPAPVLKVAVIGAGFGGLGMGVYLRKSGIDDFVIFEKKASLLPNFRILQFSGTIFIRFGYFLLVRHVKFCAIERRTG